MRQELQPGWRLQLTINKKQCFVCNYLPPHTKTNTPSLTTQVLSEKRSQDDLHLTDNVLDERVSSVLL